MSHAVRIALNTIALDPNRWTQDKKPFYELSELAPAISNAGFDNSEIWQYHISTLPEGAFRRLAQDISEQGISAAAVGIYPVLHLEGREAKTEDELFRLVIDRAAALSAGVIKLFVGNVASNELSAEDRRRSLNRLAGYAGLAADRGIELTGETHANTMFDSVESTVSGLRELDLPNFKVCFQPYDFASTARAIADLSALSDYVTHFHFQGRSGGVHSLLEEADLDYEAIVGEMASLGIDALWSIEFVKGCVVADPAGFDLPSVLDAAQRDRAYLYACAERAGLVVQ